MPHPKNLHNGRYDFEKLIDTYPPLDEFVGDNGHGERSICFFDPQSVKALNKALLLHFYGVEWDIPPRSLTPPIPGRADYIHHLADLISGIKGDKPITTILDVGVGANCIYPIIGVTQYGWHFIGADIDETSLDNAQQIIDKNPPLHGKIILRKQSNRDNIFRGVIHEGEYIDATICNPPFHDSFESAHRGTMRKLNNLKAKGHAKLNFAGRSNELWCEGGELAFISKMIVQSVEFKDQCSWFTTLVSKESNIPSFRRELKKIDAKHIRIIDMQQGNKRSRILAWRF